MRAATNLPPQQSTNAHIYSYFHTFLNVDLVSVYAITIPSRGVAQPGSASGLGLVVPVNTDISYSLTHSTRIHHIKARSLSKK